MCCVFLLLCHLPSPFSLFTCVLFVIICVYSLCAPPVLSTCVSPGPVPASLHVCTWYVSGFFAHPVVLTYLAYGVAALIFNTLYFPVFGLYGFFCLFVFSAVHQTYFLVSDPVSPPVCFTVWVLTTIFYLKPKKIPTLLNRKWWINK